MTDPTITACPHCGTMLHRAFNVMFEVSGGAQHWTERCRDVLHAKLEERTRERDVWQRMAEWRAKMMMHYRIGSHPTEATMRDGDEVRVALERLRR